MSNLKKDIEKHESFMSILINEAKKAAENGNYPLASCVVQHDKILSMSSSGLVKSVDPTAHPEIVVIREATHSINNRYLKGGILYTTLEPCPMCTSAAIWAKFDGIVYGASQEDALSWAKNNPDPLFTWRQIQIKAKDVIKKGDPQLWIVENVLNDQCCELFSLMKS